MCGQEKRDEGAFTLLEKYFFLQEAYITFIIKILIEIKTGGIYHEKICVKDVQQCRGQYLQRSTCTRALFTHLFLILGLATVEDNAEWCSGRELSYVVLHISSRLDCRILTGVDRE